jgi:hypothetical protein
MTARVTVCAELRPTEVMAFPMEDGAPAANGEWKLLATLQPGESREFFAHSRRIISARTIPAEPQI